MISWPAASSHRDLALEDRDERIARVADLEQRLADLGGPLLAVFSEHRELELESTRVIGAAIDPS